MLLELNTNIANSLDFCLKSEVFIGLKLGVKCLIFLKSKLLLNDLFKDSVVTHLQALQISMKFIFR